VVVSTTGGEAIDTPPVLVAVVIAVLIAVTAALAAEVAAEEPGVVVATVAN
jgi:hypothetical protein